MTEEEIEKMKIGLWNIRAENLRAIECSLADTQDKTGWQKEVDTIDNAFKYIEQLESDKQKLIEKLEEDILTSSIECRNREMFREDVYGHIKYKTKNYYAQEILSFVKGEKK